MSVEIEQLSVEHHESGFAIETPSPRLSWRFKKTEVKDWTQSAYEVNVKYAGEDDEVYRVDSPQSVLVPWPSRPLVSRDRVHVKVRSHGKDGSTTGWAEVRIEAALMKTGDWKSSMITGPPQQRDAPKRPFRLRKRFTLSATSGQRARLYATAYGIYEVEINGNRVGDQLLTPGWTSYNYHLNYQTYDIAQYLEDGENEITAHIAEGWYAGRLGKAYRNIWGDRLGFMGQVEVDGKVVCPSDESWEHLASSVLESEIYNGEVVDTAPRADIDIPIGSVSALPFPSALLVSSEAPPVRRIKTIKPIEIITTPSGKKVLDFGQNLVGFLRIEKDFHEGQILGLRHAEVMENKELGVRPLRTALARAEIRLGGQTKGWEPKFTFYGFRYAEISYEGDISLNDFTAVVIASDLRRTGHFECSHQMINKLHQNVVWGMLGNFVSLPTDCPQRDERLGWTGDIQVFGSTANYLFDTHSFLSGWLKDVAAEQKQYDGVPPIFVPWTPPPKDAVNPLGGHKPKAHGAWADVVAITPWDLYNASGDDTILARQFESMTLWLERGLPRLPSGLWNGERPQYGDWLDPKAPPQYPAHGRTDYLLPANAYLVSTTGLVAKIAKILGKTQQAEHYEQEYKRLRGLFRDEYITKNGRISSDTQTAFTLALWFDLVDEDQRQHAVDRLDFLIRWDYFKISTGFAGTPLILPNLAKHGKLDLAYRMLQERDNPSWLYSVGMGATTIWERWDSMLPDGSVNPGQMTSFNHYALGSVANFLHSTVGGLSPLEPGWTRALVKPQPGGTVSSASTSFDSPLGPYSVSWVLEGEELKVQVGVPPNGSAQIILPSVDEVVNSGRHSYSVKWQKSQHWPPKGHAGPQSVLIPDRFVE